MPCAWHTRTHARRYVYHETLGRWHTVDLFVGLAYLANRDAVEYPAADIAAHGTPVSVDLSPGERAALVVRWRGVTVWCGVQQGREEGRGARIGPGVGGRELAQARAWDGCGGSVNTVPWCRVCGVCWQGCLGAWVPPFRLKP